MRRASRRRGTPARRRGRCIRGGRGRLPSSSLIPSASASSACTRCGHGLIVQVPSCIVRSRYGGRRTAPIGETRGDARAVPARPGGRLPQPWLVRGLPASRVRALPGMATGARARARRLHRSAARRAARRRSIGARRLRRCRAGRPDLRPERDDRREHGGALARPPAGRRGARDRARVRRVRSRLGSGLRARPGRATSGWRRRCRSATSSSRSSPPAPSGRASCMSPTSRRRRACCCRSRRSCAARREAGLVTVVDGAHASRPGSARPRGARRGFLCGQLPQVALRAEGSRLPPRAAGASGARRRADRQLGARGAGDVHLPDASSRERATRPPT